MWHVEYRHSLSRHSDDELTMKLRNPEQGATAIIMTFEQEVEFLNFEDAMK